MTHLVGQIPCTYKMGFVWKFKITDLNMMWISIILPNNNETFGAISISNDIIQRNSTKSEIKINDIHHIESTYMVGACFS